MIKVLSLADSQSVQLLNSLVLGYEASLEEITERLATLLANDEHILLGAFSADGDLLGYVHGVRYDCLYFPPLLNLMALAVKQEEQGKGYGRALMTAVEDTAKTRGFSGIRINSGIGREKAHRFYQSLHYVERPEQKRFIKLF